MSNEIKMSDVFRLPICQNESRHFKHVVYSEVTDGVLFSCHSDDTAKFACHAINNHDRLVEENKRLREFCESLQLDVSNEIKLEQLLSELGGD